MTAQRRILFRRRKARTEQAQEPLAGEQAAMPAPAEQIQPAIQGADVAQEIAAEIVGEHERHQVLSEQRWRENDQEEGE